MIETKKRTERAADDLFLPSDGSISGWKQLSKIVIQKNIMTALQSQKGFALYIILCYCRSNPSLRNISKRMAQRMVLVRVFFVMYSTVQVNRATTKETLRE